MIFVGRLFFFTIIIGCFVPPVLWADINDDLLTAAKNGNLAAVKKAIDGGARIDYALEEESVSAIMFAVKRQSKALVDYLLTQEPSLTRKDKEGNSIVHYAVIGGNIDILKTLLEKGARPLIKNSKGQQALHFATGAAGLKMIPLLLEKGVKINEKDGEGNTLEHIAVQKNDANLIKFLQKENLTFESKNNQGKTPLILACELKLRAPLLLILPGITNLDMKDNSGKTALHYCVLNAYMPVKELLEKKASPNLLDDNGESPLIGAANLRLAAFVKLLLAAGATADAVDKENKHLLFTMLSKNYYEIFEELLKSGANPNAKDPAGVPLLHDIIHRNWPYYYNIMIKYKADLNLVNVEKQTPLIHIIEKNRYNLLQPIITAGADIKIKSPKNELPIELVVTKGYSHMLDPLLKAGANVNIKDKDGTPLLLTAHNLLWTAFNTYRSQIFVKLVELSENVSLKAANGRPILFDYVEKGYDYYTGILLKKNFPVDMTDNDKNQAIHRAAFAGFQGVLKLLLDAKADINAKGFNDFSPLMLAVQKNHFNLAKFILSYKPDIEAINSSGQTAFALATQSQNLPMMRLLIQMGASVTSADENGNNMLHEIAKAEPGKTNKTTYDIIDILRSGSIDFNAKNKFGATPLSYALNRKNVAMIRKLLEFGANINAQDLNGNSLLKKIVLMANYDRLKNKELEDLMYLALENGANINIQDNLKITPLIEAVRKGLNKDITGAVQAAEILLNYSAATAIKDNEGNDAEDYAKSLSEPALRKMFKASALLKATRSGFKPLQLGGTESDSIEDMAFGPRDNFVVLLKSGDQKKLLSYSEKGKLTKEIELTEGDKIFIDKNNDVYLLSRGLGEINTKKDARCKVGTNFVMILRKFDIQLNEKWSKSEGVIGVCDKTQVHQIYAHDDEGVMVGYSFGNNAYRYLVHFDSEGIEKKRIKVIDSWEYFIKGNNGEWAVFGSKIWIYSSEGKIVRNYNYQKTDRFSAASFDNEGNLFITGNVKAKDMEIIFLDKLNDKGALIFRKKYSSGKKDITMGLTLHTDGSVYISGITNGSLHGQKSSSNEIGRIFLMKCDTTGTREYTSVLEGEAASLVKGVRAVYGGVFIFGSTAVNFAGQLGGEDAFVIKYSHHGEFFNR